ncbi:MAG: glycosyltransferase family 4 protein [Alphaproteobacteria bacterium]|nr:glycosyltransferase family 4 protein [Alphaproteobacteria bacterium]
MSEPQPLLLMVANARFPTEWAHGVQIVAMARAFARQGRRVVLAVPDVDNPLERDPFAFFGVPADFEVRWLPVRGKLDTTAERLSFARSVAGLVRRLRPTLVVSRDEVAGAAAAALAPTIVEVHKLPGRRQRLYATLLRAARGVVSTNAWKRDALADLGLPAGRVRVLPNGTDVDGIAAAVPVDLREQLRLPPGARLVLYSGHLHTWKGVETLVDAVPLLGDDVHVALLGGRDKDVARFRETHRHPRLHILGRVSADRVAGHLKAADVLVLPNVPVSQESRHETSPLKLFEYMAAGRPVVASDLPAVREIIDETCAVLVPAGDPAALAAGISGLQSQPAQAAGLAEAALARVQAHSWDRRAAQILDFAGQLR